MDKWAIIVELFKDDAQNASSSSKKAEAYSQMLVHWSFGSCSYFAEECFEWIDPLLGSAAGEVNQSCSE